MPATTSPRWLSNWFWFGFLCHVIFVSKSAHAFHTSALSRGDILAGTRLCTWQTKSICEREFGLGTAAKGKHSGGLVTLQASSRPDIRRLNQRITSRRKGTIRVRPHPTLWTGVTKFWKESGAQLARRLSVGTLWRVFVPTILSAVLGYVYFDAISVFLCKNWLFAFKYDVPPSFIPNILQALGLLFSLLAADAFLVLYQQQDSIYRALFHEVSEAKSLLQQTALVCQGRSFYPAVLGYIAQYIKYDLRCLHVSPREMMALRPSADPLEKIMYATSVGVPSVVYDTVKDLRLARSRRLGACQRKFPFLGILLLYILGFLELATFPLLGAGTIAGAGTGLEFVCKFQSALFAGLLGATVLVLRIIGEMWRQSGGIFNADAVLARMVTGLESELAERSRNLDLRPRQAASP